MTSASSDWQIRPCREIEEKSGPFVRSLEKRDNAGELYLALLAGAGGAHS